MKLLPMANSELLQKQGIYNHNMNVEWTFVKNHRIEGLYRMENVIQPELVTWYKRLTPYHEPVRIVVFRGRRYVWDGNHRVHARLNKGLKTVQALVLELENETHHEPQR